jgi:N-acetylglucosaminyldiphosphoundecaprenol N-acetyl-beta-D-mannosaminyltransferase
MNDSAITKDIVNIIGVPVNRLSFNESISTMLRWAQEPGHHHVVTVNPEFVMIAQKDEAFRNVLWNASLRIPDGIGIVAAAKLLGKPVHERVTGVDTVRTLAREGAKYGLRFFLLGAAPGVAERAAEILCTEYPGLIIAGTYAGSPTLEEEDEICMRIQSAHPHVLLVAYGAPKQDLWIARTAHKLHIPLALGIGGTFDFIAGTMKRAPVWMQKLGIEWLFRLLQEPARWKRMLRLPQFALAVVRSILTGKKIERNAA